MTTYDCSIDVSVFVWDSWRVVDDGTPALLYSAGPAMHTNTASGVYPVSSFSSREALFSIGSPFSIRPTMTEAVGGVPAGNSMQ